MRVKLRGFDAPRYLDGLRLPLDPGTQFAYPRIEPYGLERLEVLSGPSSGLYGQTEPGGLINMVSKRPTVVSPLCGRGTFGSFDRFQGAFDVGGPIDKNGEFLYRIVGLGRSSDSQQDFVHQTTSCSSRRASRGGRRRHHVHGPCALPEQRQQRHPAIRAGRRRGSVPNPFGRVPYSRYIGEPAADGYKLEQGAIGYAFEHRFNNIFSSGRTFATPTSPTISPRTAPKGCCRISDRGARSFNYV